MSLESFRQVLVRVQQESVLSFPESWLQGRTAFGGLISAALFTAARSQVPKDRSPRACNISFIGPVLADKVATLHTQILRTGGAVTHVRVHLEQQQQILASLDAVFGLPRPSKILIDQKPAPKAPPPKECQAFPFQKGVTPTFTNNLDYYWAFGSLPFQSSARALVGGWCRFRDSSGPLECSEVLALLDAWPAPVLSMLDKRTPASSITWSVLFSDNWPTVKADQFLLYHSQSQLASSGYAETSARLWTHDGHFLACSQQCVAVYG